MTANRYTFTQRFLHWVLAVLVLGLLFGGLTFGTLGYEGLSNLVGAETAGKLFTYHKSIGVLVLLLTILRLVLRVRGTTPPYDPPLSGVERAVSGVTLLLLYLLSLGVPIGGMVATAVSGYPLEFFTLSVPSPLTANEALGETLFFYHGLGGLALGLTVLLHMAAGIKHWRLKDGVMTRISLP